MVELAREALHTSVTDPVSTSMNFLNEVAGRFPDAISLAAGRPYDAFYAVEDVERYLTAYVSYSSTAGRTVCSAR
jgi:(S)-3,5-dihydroxyphenylglycine transaminase